MLKGVLVSVCQCVLQSHMFVLVWAEASPAVSMWTYMSLCILFHFCTSNSFLCPLANDDFSINSHPSNTNTHTHTDVLPLFAKNKDLIAQDNLTFKRYSIPFIVYWSVVPSHSHHLWRLESVLLIFFYSLLFLPLASTGIYRELVICPFVCIQKTQSPSLLVFLHTLLSGAVATPAYKLIIIADNNLPFID